MKVFLCGGGADEQTAEVNQLYAGMIDLSKPVLYLPTAMECERVEGCMAWIKGELAPYGINEIEVLADVNDFPAVLGRYSSIYIGGGNTYRLLTLLKQSDAFERIRKYVDDDGVVMGGSAGAIIFGKDIHCTEYSDENITELTDTSGFDILGGHDVCCHYTNQSEERNAFEQEAIVAYVSKGNKVLALPEETHLFVEEDRFTVIGKKECTLFECGMITQIAPKTEIVYGRKTHGF